MRWENDNEWQVGKHLEGIRWHSASSVLTAQNNAKLQAGQLITWFKFLRLTFRNKSRTLSLHQPGWKNRTEYAR
jgi:hypothetical protein